MPFVYDRRFRGFSGIAEVKSSQTRQISLTPGTISETLPTGAVVTNIAANATFYNGPDDPTHAFNQGLARISGASGRRSWDQSGPIVTINSDLTGTATIAFTMPGEAATISAATTVETRPASPSVIDTIATYLPAVMPQAQVPVSTSPSVSSVIETLVQKIEPGATVPVASPSEPMAVVEPGPMPGGLSSKTLLLIGGVVLAILVLRK